MTASEAAVEIAKYLAPVIAAWLAKVRKDMNALFPKIRSLEDRVKKLEDRKEAS